MSARHVLKWLHRCEACAQAERAADPTALPGVCGLRNVSHAIDGPCFVLLCDECGAELNRRRLAELQADLDSIYADAVERHLDLVPAAFFELFPQVVLFAWAVRAIRPRVRTAGASESEGEQ